MLEQLTPTLADRHETLFIRAIWASLLSCIVLNLARLWMVWDDLQEDGNPFTNASSRLTLEYLGFLILTVRNVGTILYVRSQHIRRSAASATQFQAKNLLCRVALKSQSDMHIEMIVLAGSGLLFKWLAYGALNSPDTMASVQGEMLVQIINYISLLALITTCEFAFHDITTACQVIKFGQLLELVNSMAEHSVYAGLGTVTMIDLGGSGAELAIGKNTMDEVSAATVGLGRDCCHGSDGRLLLRTDPELQQPTVRQPGGLHGFQALHLPLLQVQARVPEPALLRRGARGGSGLAAGGAANPQVRRVERGGRHEQRPSRRLRRCGGAAVNGVTFFHC